VDIEDSRLIQEIREGKPQSLKILYEKYHRPVRAVALRYMGSDGADDVLQDVFLKVWQQPWRIDPKRGPLGPYLVRMARNHAIDELRRQGREVPVQEQGVDAYLQEFDELPESLNILNADEQHVILLTFYGDLTQQQIADQYGIALGTVKTRLRTGMDKLRRHYGLT
jgi:RNA polymerase sigma-70 factor (ECF subfamily)